jgi:hypothetical protein
MPRFAFLVEVENVVVNWDGIKKPVGCFVTRVVRANNKSSAMEAAIARVRDDLRSKGELLNGADNPPRFKIETSRRLRFWNRSIDTGFAYFEESDEA